MTRADADITVIIPAYNAADTLACAVGSGQRSAQRAAVEIVIVNDGSTDATAAVGRRLAEQDQRIQLISQDNRGLAAARNTGLDEARGRFVVFLDADDALAPGSLDEPLRLAQRGGGAGVVSAWWNAPEASWGDVDLSRARSEVAMEAALSQFAWLAEPPARGVDWALLSQRNPAPVHTYLTSRDVIGSARFDESLLMLEDWAFWRQLAAGGARWTTAAQPQAVYRLRKASMSSADLRMCATAERVLSSSDGASSRKADRDAMRRFALERATLAHCRGAHDDARAIVDRWLEGARLGADEIGQGVVFAFSHALHAPPWMWLDPPQAWLMLLERWIASLEARHACEQAGHGAIARSIAARATAPALVAQRIVEAVASANASIELVGLGVNGRAIVNAARALGVAVRGRDDALHKGSDAGDASDAGLALEGVAIVAPDAPRAPGAVVVLSPECDEALLGRFGSDAVRWREVRADVARAAAQRIAGGLSSAHALAR